MDENKIIIDLIKLYADNSGYFKDALDQAQTAMYISIVAILVSLAIGYWNYHIAKKRLKIQAQKAYREIITSEKVKAYNSLREACANYLTAARGVLDGYISTVEKVRNPNKATIEFDVLTECIDFIGKYNHAQSVLRLQLSDEELLLVEGKMNQWRKKAEKIKSDEDYENAYQETLVIDSELRKILRKRWEKIEEEATINC